MFTLIFILKIHTYGRKLTTNGLAMTGMQEGHRHRLGNLLNYEAMRGFYRSVYIDQEGLNNWMNYNSNLTRDGMKYRG